jgi:hemerythrin
MATIDLESIPQVATAFQNDDHREEAHLLNLAIDGLTSNAPKEELHHRFDALARHTREHFAREDAAMERTGFPALAMHEGEHERVLIELDEKLDAWREGGEPAVLLTYLRNDVPTWFVAHIRTMDTVTAQWLASHGG